VYHGYHVDLFTMKFKTLASPLKKSTTKANMSSTLMSLLHLLNKLRYQGLDMFWNFPHEFQACKKQFHYNFKSGLKCLSTHMNFRSFFLTMNSNMHLKNWRQEFERWHANWKTINYKVYVTRFPISLQILVVEIWKFASKAKCTHI
jgi:hypothetical protein